MSKVPGRSCVSCIHRWFGTAPKSTYLWRCRKDPKASRGQLKVIGNNDDLAASTGCKDFLKGNF